MLQGLIIANADPAVFWLNNFYLFIYLLLRFAYGGVLLMTAFLKIYPIPKIRNISIYRLAYSIAMYRNPVSWYVSYHQILANTHPYIKFELINKIGKKKSPSPIAFAVVKVALASVLH